MSRQSIRKGIQDDVRSNREDYLDTILTEANKCCSDGTMSNDDVAILEATVCSEGGGFLARFVGAFGRQRTWQKFTTWCIRNRREAGAGEDEEKTWLQIFLEWLQDGGLQAILEFVMAIISRFSMSGES